MASAALVTSCPTSKVEWDTAALKKNCRGIASQQNCAPVDKFRYHCVINGYRNETLEVCAPSRIIFGHCVEFNQLGGVIQDQWSSPCNDTFPKCDVIYASTAAYKYPDCYELVSMDRNYVTTESMPLSNTKEGTSTTTSEYVIIIPMIILFLFVMILIIVVKPFKGRKAIPIAKENIGLTSSGADHNNTDETISEKDNCEYRLMFKAV